MSFLARSRRKGFSRQGKTRYNSGVGRKSYTPNGQSLVWRHEYDSQLEGTSIAAGAYVEVPLLRFSRSFSGTADTPPSPTASNNYQTERVFNGSRVQRFNAVMNIQSFEKSSPSGDAAQDFQLDLYAMVTSFYDAYVFNGLFPTLCPVDFDTSSTNEGEVDFKSVPITLTTNGYKNYKFVQHYMKYLGRIVIPQGGNANININKIPSKCIRSQTGMFWGLMVHNPSQLNSGNAFQGAVQLSSSFEEIPSDERLPWLY